MDESKEFIAKEEITAETLLGKARQAGESLREISSQYPETAKLLLFWYPLVEEEISDDPDTLTARQLVMDFEFGNELNCTNLVNHLLEERPKYMNLQRVDTSLDRLVELTSSQKPDDLYIKAQQAIYQGWKLLISEYESKKKRRGRIKNLKEQEKGAYRAMSELRPYLSVKKPS